VRGAPAAALSSTAPQQHPQEQHPQQQQQQRPTSPPAQQHREPGPPVGPFARLVRSLYELRTSRKQQAALYGGAGLGPGGIGLHAHQTHPGAVAAAAMAAGGPHTVADHKLMAQYNSHAAVLGGSTAVQMHTLRFDDVGRRQVAVEERFLLGRGIIHPYNTLCVAVGHDEGMRGQEDGEEEEGMRGWRACV
jgi:hypothetical protein